MMPQYISTLKYKFIAANRTYSRFQSKEELWLNCDFPVNLKLPAPLPGPGRPPKCWEDLGERSKRSKVSELASKNNTDVLTQAAIRSTQNVPGKADLAYVLKKHSR